MRRRTRFFAVVALLLFAAAGAVAQDKGAVLFKRLGLSEAQVGQARKVYADANAGARMTREDLKIQRAELAKALMAKVPARADYEGIVRRIADLEASLRLTCIEAELQIRAAVGDDKWAQLRRTMRNLPEKAKAELKEKRLRRSGAK
jgi:hypothetical protein